MKHDELPDMSGSDGKASADANEVRQKVVRAFTQMVGDAMSADWTRQSLEMAQGAAAGETQRQSDDPAPDALTFLQWPPVDRFRRAASDAVPAIGVGSFTSRLEQALGTWPHRYGHLPARTSLVNGLPYVGRRPRLSPRLRGLMDQPFDLSGTLSSRVGYNPFAHLDLLGNTKFEIINIQPMEGDLTPFSLSLGRRKKLRSLPFGDSYGALRSLLENTEPRDLGGLLDFPVSMKLSNNQEVADGDDNGTIEKRD